MAVIETDRLCRRNGMANIFTGIDITDIEYLSSLDVSAPTSSVYIANPNDAHTQQISYEVTSLMSEDSSDPMSDDDEKSEQEQDHR